jgi:hypothetical protein
MRMRKQFTKTLLAAACLVGGAWAADEIRQSMPSLPTGATAKTLNDQKDERGVLAKVTNHAVTKGGFDDVIERLSTPDRKRIGDFVKRDFPDLDGRIDQIRKNWTTKYGKDFDITEALFADFTVIQEGEITDPAEFNKHWPVPTGFVGAVQAAAKNTADAVTGNPSMAMNTPDSAKLYDSKGRNVAVVYLKPEGNLPAFTVSMVHEAIDDWRVDVPDDVQGQQIYSALKDALTSFGDNVAAWPADQKDAYHLMGHRVVMSLYGVSTNAEARTAGERQTPMPQR